MKRVTLRDSIDTNARNIQAQRLRIESLNRQIMELATHVVTLRKQLNEQNRSSND